MNIKRIGKAIMVLLLATPALSSMELMAQDLKIKTIWELGIPGKIAPLSSAEYIKETIYNILKRKEDNK